MTRYTLTPDTLVETDEGWSGTWAELCDANADAIECGELDLAEAVAALCEHGRVVVGMCDEIRIVSPLDAAQVDTVRAAPTDFLNAACRTIQFGKRRGDRAMIVRAAQTAAIACLTGA